MLNGNLGGYSMVRFPIWYKIKSLEFHDNLNICVLIMDKEIFGFIKIGHLRLVRHIDDKVEFRTKEYSCYHKYIDGYKWGNFSEKYNAIPFSKYTKSQKIGYGSIAQVVQWSHESIFKSPLHKRESRLQSILKDIAVYQLN